jgi:hypothetical protein
VNATDGRFCGVQDVRVEKGSLLLEHTRGRRIREVDAGWVRVFFACDCGFWDYWVQVEEEK